MRTKKIFTTVFSLLMLFLLPIQATAETIFDDCISPYGGLHSNYQNLVNAESFGNQYTDLPDTTCFRLINFGIPGAAIYNVESATEMTISIYSSTGTFATQGSDGWMLGFNDQAVYKPSRLLFSPETNQIFLSGEGKWKECVYFEGNYIFNELEQPPLIELVNYGVTALASSNGEKYEELPLTLLSAKKHISESGDTLYQEVYGVKIPPSMKLIRVELQTPAQNVFLSSVSISVPEPDPIPPPLPEPPPPPEPDKPKPEKPAPKPEKPTSKPDTVKKPTKKTTQSSDETVWEVDYIGGGGGGASSSKPTPKAGSKKDAPPAIASPSKVAEDPPIITVGSSADSVVMEEEETPKAKEPPPTSLKIARASAGEKAILIAAGIGISTLPSALIKLLVAIKEFIK